MSGGEHVCFECAVCGHVVTLWRSEHLMREGDVPNHTYYCPTCKDARPFKEARR